jgi:Tfp pilus assembly protein PilN
MLNEVAQALPPLTWLINVAHLPPAPSPQAVTDSTATDAPPPPVQLQLTGRTVDIQGYTRFMRQLEDSPWLNNVTAVSANTVVESGRAVTAFVLTATFSRPSPDRIQTVSVAQSVTR